MTRGKTRTAACAAILVSLGLAGAAQAATVQIDLSSFVNADLTTYTGASSYPQHGGTVILDNIPFLLSTIGPQADTAVLQTNSSETFSIPISVYGATTADVMVNSAFGACNTDIGAIKFVGAAETFVYTLTDGANVRDHHNGQFCNTAPGIAGTVIFGADRLDVQSIVLPAGFATDTLEQIDFSGLGKGRSGDPFLAAATIVTLSSVTAPSSPTTIPEPSQLGIALMGAAGMLWRKLAVSARR